MNFRGKQQPNSAPAYTGRKSKKKRTGLAKILYSEPHEYKNIKIVFGFMIGLAFGYGLYWFVLNRLQLPPLLDYILGGSFLIAFSVGFALSSNARCIILLIIPTFFGKSGRSYIGTFAISYLLAGPITNIMRNGEEVTRAIGCSAELSQNLTRARLKLRLMPLHNIMEDLQKQAVKIYNTTLEARKAFQPVEMELEGDEVEMVELRKRQEEVDKEEGGLNRAKVIEEKYAVGQNDSRGTQLEKKFAKKYDYQCEDIFSMGVKSCKKAFSSTYNKCKKEIKFKPAQVLCLPLKLDAMCNLVKVIGKAGVNCNSMDVTNPGLGEEIDTARQAAAEMDRNFQVNLQYKVVENKEALDRKTPADVVMAIKYAFKQRKQWIDFASTLFQRMLAFMFLRVLWSAHKYNKKYTSDFRFDNVYITDYFRHIDRRRALQGQDTLLPLKKCEAKELITLKSVKLSNGERSKLVGSTLRLIFRAVLFGIIMFMDKCIFEILDLIQRHSRITYKQTGTHHIDLRVHGDGVMGQLVKSLLGGFNQHHDLQQDTSNFACLPAPTRTPPMLLVRILVVFICLWLLMFTEAYGLRLRRMIASYFHRKREKKRILFLYNYRLKKCIPLLPKRHREKKRILYLYNDGLKKRRGFLKHMRHVVKRKAKDAKLKRKNGGLFQFLDRFRRPKRQCLICEETLGRRHVVCPTPKCQFTYCHTCWEDIERNCYGCRDSDDWTTTDSSEDVDLD